MRMHNSSHILRIKEICMQQLDDLQELRNIIMQVSTTKLIEL